MTPTMPHIAPGGSYSVTQAAKLLDIDRKTLRRYEAAGLVVAHCNQLGRRKYSGRELIKLWQIIINHQAKKHEQLQTTITL